MVPYRDGSYYPPIRDDDPTPYYDRAWNMAHLLRSGQAAMGAVMVGFIFLPLFPMSAFLFAVIGMFTGLYAHYQGFTVGTVSIILGILLAVLSIIFASFYLTFLTFP